MNNIYTNKIFKYVLSFLFINIIFFSTTACSDSGVSLPDESGTYAIMKTDKGTIIIKLMPEIAPKTVENFIGLAEGTKEWTDPTTGNKQKKVFYDGLIFHRVINDFMIQGGCPLGNGTGGPGYQFEDECFEKGEQITGKINDQITANSIWATLIRPYLQEYHGNPPSTLIKELYQKIQQLNSLEPLIGIKIEDLQKQTGNDKPIYTKGALLHPIEYGTLCMANAGPDTNGSQFFIVTKKDGCSWLNGKHTVFGKVVKGMDIVHKIEQTEKGANDRPIEDIHIKTLTIHKK